MEKVVLRRPDGVESDGGAESRPAAEVIRRKIARRAAAEFKDGMNVNLGRQSGPTNSDIYNIYNNKN